MRLPGRDVMWPIVIGLAIAAAVGWVLWVVDDLQADDKADDDRITHLEAEVATNRDAAEALSSQVERLCGKRPTCEPVVEPDELPDVEEIQDLELQDPELQEPERQERERNDPDPNDPERQDPESDDPESQDSEFDDPEQQEPEEQDPESDDPDPDDPDPDDPDPNDPDPNDEMDSFTFEWMGQTYRCTDPDNDRHWTCEPEES